MQGDGLRSRSTHCMRLQVHALSIHAFSSTHAGIVNSVSWAPHELGAILACASSDGKVSVLTFKSSRIFI